MKPFFTLLSLLLITGSATAQQYTKVLSDTIEARYVDYYNIKYTRHRQLLTDDDRIVRCDTQYMSNDYKFIETWEPQGELPVQSAVYTLIAPADYQLQFSEQGDCGVYALPPDTVRTTAANGSQFKVCTYKFEARNIQPIVKDEYIFTTDDYRYKLFPIISKIENVNGRIEEINTTWEIIDYKLLNSPLLEQYNTPDNPVGQKVAKLKSEGNQVYPVVLRRRSSGKMSQIVYPSVDAYDAIVIAKQTPKGLVYIDPTLPDSIEHLLPEDYLVNYARLLEIDKDGNVNGKWINLFDSSDYRIVANVNITIGPDAVLHKDNNMYYRNRAALVENRQTDHRECTIQLQFDGDSISFSPYFDIRIDEQPDSTRTLPIEYPYCVYERYNFIINVDDSFKIDSYPTSGIFYSQTGAFACNFKTIVEGQKLSIIYILQRNVMLQLPSAHEYTRAFYQMLDEKFKETVVLRLRRSS